MAAADGAVASRAGCHCVDRGVVLPAELPMHLLLLLEPEHVASVFFCQRGRRVRMIRSVCRPNEIQWFLVGAVHCSLMADMVTEDIGAGQHAEHCKCPLSSARLWK